MTFFRIAADAVLVAHLAFVAFVVLGGLLVLRWRGVAWLHLPAAAWGALIEFAGLPCPLTPLEKWLRVRGGEAGYEGGFIEHYVTSLLYPEGLTRELQVAIGVLVVAVNATVYFFVWRRRSSRGDAHL